MAIQDWWAILSRVRTSRDFKGSWIASMQQQITPWQLCTSQIAAQVRGSHVLRQHYQTI